MGWLAVDRLVLYALVASVTFLAAFTLALLAFKQVYTQPPGPEVHVYVYRRVSTQTVAKPAATVKPVATPGRTTNRLLGEAIRNGTLLVAPPAGRGLLERGVPNTTYPLWDRLAVVNTSDPSVKPYVEWLCRLLEAGLYRRGYKQLGFDDALALPHPRYWSGAPRCPEPNATARMGTVLLPYGFAATVLIAPCDGQLCAYIHMYAWNKTGLAHMYVRGYAADNVGFVGEPVPEREKRILWVVEWPVDTRHSAVLVYNGTGVARVKRVYLVLEEPLFYREDLGDVYPVYRAAKWFWGARGHSGRDSHVAQRGQLPRRSLQAGNVRPASLQRLLQPPGSGHNSRALHVHP